MKAIPPCATCKHFDGKRLTGNFCAAFPTKEGIPAEILKGENRHTEPYPGDNDIQYEPRESTE